MVSKGQISVEMLILIAVIIAVIAIAASQLLKTADKTSQEVDKRSDEVLKTTETAMKSKKGGPCTSDSSCAEGLRCNMDSYVCE
ncbi:MAG: class III signal peptide-containing protein [Candidatus Micrarchaeota archaeon]